MKKLLALFIGIVAFFGTTPSQAWLVQGPAAAPAYSGPGDVQSSGWVSWFGMRAFSAATRGSALINVCLPSDSACADFASDATTGELPATFTITATTCNNSTTICTIKTFYDFGSFAANVSQTTIASRATLKVSCVGSLPCAHFTNASAGYIGPAFETVTAPFSISAVFNITSTGGFDVAAITDSGGDSFIGTSSGPVAELENGGLALRGAADLTAVLAALNGTINGSSSTLNANGTALAGTIGSSNISGQRINLMSGGSGSMAADWFEAGVNSNALSTTVQGNVCTNQKAQWSISGASC